MTTKYILRDGWGEVLGAPPPSFYYGPLGPEKGIPEGLSYPFFSFPHGRILTDPILHRACACSLQCCGIRTEMSYFLGQRCHTLQHSTLSSTLSFPFIPSSVNSRALEIPVIAKHSAVTFLSTLTSYESL